MSQENVNLFLQLDRDIGTLVSMLSDCKLIDEDRLILKEIAERMDEASPKLQAILYPASVQGDEPGR